MRIYLGLDYLKKELSPIFKTKYLGADIFAGLTIACIAIPLSLAIAMASGVSPGVGLVSAIIGGIIAALLGGTTLAVTGPAAAMAVLIAANVEKYGLTGLLIIGLICGGLQILCGLFRLGRYARLVPLPVVAAFTAGIGFIIIIGQLPKALQLPAPTESHVFDVIAHIGYYITTMNPMAFVLALITLAILKILPKYFPKLPTPLIAVLIPSLIVYFGKMTQIQLVGAIPHSLSLPSLPNFEAITDWSDLLLSGLAVFALASLETLLSSSAADNMGKGDMHNSNQELIGQGAANMGVAIFGGIPVTGVIARTSVNIQAGAKTRRAAIIHSLAILAAIYLFPGLIEKIPVAALAGILLSAGISMINWKEFIDFWKTDRGEALIYIITFIAIVVTDLVEGVRMGIMVAFLIVAIKMLKTKTNISLWNNKNVMRIGINGGMTFWSFERLAKLEEYILEHIGLKFVIFEFIELRGLDSSGAQHLIATAKTLSNNGIKIIFHDLSLAQHKTLRQALGETPRYWTQTQTENEIKEILEQHGIKHSARELLEHGMQKYLVDFVRERKRLIKTLAKGQDPHTLLITCSDSRLNPNSFLSSGLGELFIVRNVGNVIPPYSPDSAYSEVAAIEFALSKLKIRNVIICAHTECGAIQAVLANNLDLNSGLGRWLKIIESGFQSHKPQTADEGVKINVLQQLANLETYPSVKTLLASNEIHISAWVYDVHTADIFECSPNSGELISLVQNK